MLESNEYAEELIENVNFPSLFNEIKYFNPFFV